MSGISSSVGLVSGIQTTELIDQLMSIESATVNSVESRVTETETTKTAWMTLSASVLGLQSAAGVFKNDSTFQAVTATSSNTNVLSATAEAGALAGTYQFTVSRLASNHQMISAGFADSSSTLGAGVMTFDMARGRLDPGTDLDFLNGQTGVRPGSIRITDRAGTTSDVDLTEATTVADVVEAINNDADLGVTARVSGDSIVLDDATGQSGTITVAEVGAGKTAEDLGLLGSATNASLVGADVNSVTTATSLSLLNDGLGIERSKAVDDMTITLRDGTVLSVNLLGAVGAEDETAETLGDVIDFINNAEDADGAANGGRLVASLSADGNSIRLVDTTGGAGDLVVADGAGSRAATQLGLAGTYSGPAGNLQIEGADLIAGLNSVLLRNLNGGDGVTAGVLELRDREDNAASVDLTGASSVADVIEAINDAGIGLTASLNDAGNGLKIVDTTGATDFHMVVADSSGDLAASLGIAVDGDVAEAAGGNLEHRYVSSRTSLDDLNPVEDWSGGSIEITNTLGASVTVNLGSSNVERVEDVIQNINAQGDLIGVSARLNDSGTGLILEDSNGGAGSLSVAESGGGHAAEQLGLLGTAEEGEAFIDGSLRTSITVSDTDTLDDVVTKINDADMGVTASILNDGSSTNPYRLVLRSDSTGRDGEIVMDAGGVGLEMTTFAEAQDALVFLGSPGGANSLALTSSTNQMTGIVDGVTFDLLGTDSQPVTVTIAEDTEAITASIESFVSSFNSIVDNIDTYTSFNAETLESGVLFGDSNVSLLRSRLMNMVLGKVSVDTGSYTSLSDVGVSLASGNTLTFDSAEFAEAFAADPEGVIALFTQVADTEEVTANGVTTDEEIAGTGGLGVNFTRILEGITDSYDGFIVNITDSLDDQIADMNDRIEQLNELLDSKRARYEQQFAAMETALAEMQSQSSALSSLSGLITTTE